jgi:hypothetical protein
MALRLILLVLASCAYGASDDVADAGDERVSDVAPVIAGDAPPAPTWDPHDDPGGGAAPYVPHVRAAE